MKYILLLCAGLLLMQGLTAQQKLDVLYFKNGSVIRGHIFETAHETIKLENRVKDTLVINKSELDSTKQEIVAPKITPHGFYNIDEGGLQFSDRKGSVWRCIVGYRFAYQYQVGVGIGLDDYQARSVPVFGDFRYDFNKAERTFFAYAGAGKALPWLTKNQWQLQNSREPDENVAGTYTHAGLGYKFRWQHNSAFHISAGYSYAAFKTKNAILDWTTQQPLGTFTTTEYSFSRVTVMVGITL
ncbi:hypothetical protein [Chitinophaga silvisoli]|uniref:Outer membrane protein beta-barrel domain-containing protein n=1 Tax=Chitinophaga silvisoli TaxID=2291814 RepID=A0A3E1P2Z8_9BACT|nr:hypothetical protein [Chitinophaga silvisoli]RFM34500.1 hypothetical protein DXN04_14590 [Chitinophaga silvisoli]